MIRQHVRRAITAGLLTCSLAAIAPARGRAQETTGLPAQGGQITLVGCFAEERLKRHNKYVLLSPSVGSVPSVTEATCTSTGTGQPIKLEKLHKAHLLDTSMLGRWVEVNGDINKMGKTSIREVHVTAIRAVPVVAPRSAEVRPAPPAMEVQPATPQAEVIAPIEAAPVGTTGIIEQPKQQPRHTTIKGRLPHTASSLPLTGLIGLFAIAGGLALRRIDRRRTLGRG